MKILKKKKKNKKIKENGCSMFDKVMEVGKVVYLIKLVLLPYNFEVNECIFQQYYLFEEATNQ